MKKDKKINLSDKRLSLSKRTIANLQQISSADENGNLFGGTNMCGWSTDCPSAGCPTGTCTACPTHCATC